MKRIKGQQSASTPLTLALAEQELITQEILHHHPNILHPILLQLTEKDFCSQLTQTQKLRVAALFGLCHPVMNKEAQEVIERLIGTRGYWQLDGNLTLLLQVLNIICLIPGINYSSLKIKALPTVAPQSYDEALWVNALPHLMHGQHHPEVAEQIEAISKENSLRIREFVNNLLSLSEKIREKVYEKEDVYAPKGHYHTLDIQLAAEWILTTDYFPSDYSSEHLELWLDRTVELNSLLGNFVCKEKFGEFQYIRGPLLYAMQKGILLVLNNFAQISNQLLVSLKSLSTESQITLNQKTIRANAGFKILGILSGDGNSKAKVGIAKLVRHFSLPSKKYEELIPQFSNEQNRAFLLGLFRENASLGYLGLSKLWRRIERLRRAIIHVQDEEDEQSGNNRLWGSFFTQDFMDSIDQELADLTNKPNQDRAISFLEKYRLICIGRTEIAYSTQPLLKIVKTQYSLKVLQKLMVCFELGEYPLLISQTGCGKTTLVQYLAELSGHKLFVYNMSSGTDVTDLVGGFKPIDCRVLLKELFMNFMDKFRAEVPNAQKNEAYLINLNNYFVQGKLELLLKSLVQSIPRIIQQLAPGTNLYEWQDMLRKFTNILGSLDKMDSNLVFSFLQGNLIKALRNGDWILIDEINLATNDVLQKIVPLIQGKSLLLYEKGDLNYIERHKDFRIVACMNPATDSGKKPLPANLAEKFTAICMAEPNKPDIEMMVKELCPQLNEYQIAELFFSIKQIKTTSLRNLSRALAYINKNKEVYGWPRSVYDGLMLGFGEKEILKAFLNQSIPKVIPGVVQISGFLLSQGPFKENASQIFHLTDTFKSHLKDLLRAIAGTDLPVLLEGPTSAGKTSMIRYVAETVGHKCIRINNHEHTEIEEYIGNYFPDRSGKLVFRQGPLVQAVREGHWLILDELNLAKTEILQCLNRLLDDNRELFIPEQQKHIKPHPNFRIFATQNPSSYSGRKTLSRAFRNRFVSISFLDINTDDMMAILEARSPLLKDSKELSVFVKKTLEALINYRQRQRVFQKDGLITIRNLLKWCERKFISKEKFAMEGYAILAEKLRTQEEKRFVEKVLLTGVKCSVQQVRQEYFQVVEQEFSQERIAATDIYVQMNDSFKRMAALTLKAVGNNEPVLLVGETGCGKTTLAELLAALTLRPFFSINCHKHMEASDLLGSLRPALNPSSNAKFEFMNGVVVQAMLEGGILLIDEINTAEDSVLERLNQVLECGLMGIQRGDGWETVQAKPGFCIIATMNPSGDYGKKELSPALRNRFTEIWVQPITHPEYIRAAKQDILKMIHHKLSFPPEIKSTLADKIYDFLVAYNCEVAPRYGLARRLLTMRDIGWICRFVNEGRWEGWEQGYFWGILILAVEGVKYIMTDTVEGGQLERMKDELLKILAEQVNVQPQWLQRTEPHHIIALIKHMDFPLLLKVDAPLQVLGIQPDQQIFFSPQTDLSDLLGQYRPVGSDFVWRDQALLRCVKEGGIVALVDLNLAQQQVIEGINSLFDHRGSLFVVELNRTFKKAATFRPVVVLRSQGGHGRKGLPNSFLNRFVKLAVPSLSIDVKLSFLMGKYANLAEDGLLFGVVKQIIQKEKALPIQSIEFVIQFSYHGLLNESLQILKLDAYKQPTAVSRFGQYQTSILELLPLKKSLQINSAAMVKTLLYAYLVYRYSRFNLCLVGRGRSRSNLSRALSYLLHSHYAKLLISTMLDINDLLGTYEQVTEGQKEGPMEEEGLLGALSVLAAQESQGFESQATKFVFVQSQLVRCLREQRNLVYVQAPSEAIAERIQKGLKEVYSLKRKILIGLDMLNSKTTISKFIPIYVPETSTSTSTSTVISYNAFPENQSSLIASDWAIRQEETQTFIVDAMNQQGETRAVTAWRRVLECLLLKTRIQEEKLVEEIEEKLRREYMQKWRVGCIVDEAADIRIERVLRQVQTCASREALLSRAMLQCFFTSDPLVLSKRMAFFNADQQALSATLRKFQILYSCNAGNFRDTSRAVMGVLFREVVDSPMIRRYFGELQRLHEELLKHKVKEILIQYNEEEYKLITILSTPQAIRYQLLNDAAPIRALCDQGPHLDHMLTGLEKVVGEAVRLMEVEVGELGRWCRDLRVRHIGALDILQATLSKRTSLGNDLRHNRMITEFLIDIDMQLPADQASIREHCMGLYQTFKPNKDMSVNVSYHLKNEMKARMIKELIAEDELFVQKYGQLSVVKYFTHQPSQLHALAYKLGMLQVQLKEVQKLLVYRGHNNIQNLIDFYQRLANHTEQIERQGFSATAIRAMILETYRSDYLAYSDVLLPLYIPLLLLYQQPNQQEISVAVRAVNTGREDALNLLQAAVSREEGEVDRSKDYLRFQKKFNRTVIVDEYTEEGVEHNKQIMQAEFQDLFGKGTGREESPLDRIHLLINKTPQGYTAYLARHVLGRAECLSGLLVGIETLVQWEEPKALNIYEEGQAGVVRALVQPVASMMEQIHALLLRYPIDNIKNLAALCNNIINHAFFDQVYKVLTDCEFLIEKTFQINAILPVAFHINTASLIQNCLKVRRVELANWRQMLGLKLRRTEKADMIEFLGLYRNIKQVANERELFVLCERYLRESALSCLPNRLRLLRFLQRTTLSGHSIYPHVLRRVAGFFQYLVPWAQKEGSKARREREKEMREYQKLAGWSSNEYLIFKATCEKFQRKIHHILRRYDEQLSLSVGTFHQQIQQQQLFNTIKEFSDGLAALVEIQANQEDSEEQEDQDEDEAKQEEQEEKEQQKQPQKKPLEQQQPKEGNAMEQQLDEYEQMNRRVFGALREIQGDHHNTQSRLLIIRAYMDDLDEAITGLTTSSKHEYKYLSREMFGDQQQYLRAVKYYYGLWDKLCQRVEIVAHRELIDKLWLAAEKVWSHVNSKLEHVPQTHPDGIAEDLSVLFAPFINNGKQAQHPLFAAEIEKVKDYISSHSTVLQVLAERAIENRLVSLMKLGYILGSIAVNMQKNGLCAKEEEEEAAGSGEQEVGDGMGIGEGEAHEGAENVGDQIEYEEQVLGHKDEEKNEDDNAQKKQEQDIEMDADFEGQMHSQQEDGEGESQEGEEKQPDEQMGQVDEDQKEKDMKNQAGQAQGEEEADVDIKGQKEGDEELVDNEHQQKEQRRGEEQRMEEEQQQQQEQGEGSDWDSHNEQGQKINKQDENVEAHDKQSNYDIDQEHPPEEVDSKQEGMDEESQPADEEKGNQQQQQPEEISEEGSREGEAEDIEEEPQDQSQQEQEEPKRKSRPSKQQGPAYGRRDMNTNDDVINQEEQPADEAGTEGNKEKGEGEGGQSSGSAVHNLSADFIEEILRQQRAEGSEQFMKDLNVLINDQNQPRDAKEEGEQFELTEQKDQFATNLPLLDDQRSPEDKQEQRQKQEDGKQERTEQANKQEAKKQKAEQQADKADKTQQKHSSADNKSKAYTEQQYEKARRQEKSLTKQQPGQRQMVPEDEQAERLVKQALDRIQSGPQPEKTIEERQGLLSEAVEASKVLQEQLKSVLQPMDSAGYRGDFRTGKKLNLRKIIPFIASNYRKDRIWLRRTEPSERNYYVMVGLDDTKSMQYGAVGEQALKGTVALSLALQHLAIRTSICSIRDQMSILKGFEDLLDTPKILSSFGFSFESSNSHDLSMAAFMKGSLEVFNGVQGGEGTELRKLCFIISDGKMNKKVVQPLMKQAKKQDVTYIFIIVDSQQSSILNIRSVEYGQNKKMRFKSYMADFPFEYFLIINDVRELADVLALTLMQFIQRQ